MLATLCEVILASHLVVFSTAAVATPIVAPSHLANTDREGYDAFPFGVQLSRMRYQQIFDASEFTNLSGTNLLNGIALRADWSSEAYSSLINRLWLRVSTTTREVNGMSYTFDNNSGPDVTTVFDGPLLISHVPQQRYPGPQDFDLIIPFNVPFVYDPTEGNLLLDYLVETGREVGSGLDSASSGAWPYAPTTARLYGYIGPYGSFPGYGIGQGLVTQFQFSVPEPGTVSLVILGLFALSVRRLTRKA